MLSNQTQSFNITSFITKLQTGANNRAKAKNRRAFINDRQAGWEERSCILQTVEHQRQAEGHLRVHGQVRRAVQTSIGSSHRGSQVNEAGSWWSGSQRKTGSFNL